jgi:Ca-activated chloride channel family protein
MMNQDTHDSRATAYVFGELSPAEVAKFERELDASAELRDEVAGIEEAVAAVQAEFESQTQGLSEADRSRIESALADRPTAANTACDAAATRRPWLVPLAVAASVVLVVGLSIPALTHFRQRELAMNEVQNARTKQTPRAVTELETAPEELAATSQRLRERTTDEKVKLEQMRAAGEADISDQLADLSEIDDRDELGSSLSRDLAEAQSGPTAGNQPQPAATKPPTALSVRGKMEGEEQPGGKPPRASLNRNHPGAVPVDEALSRTTSLEAGFRAPVLTAPALPAATPTDAAPAPAEPASTSSAPSLVRQKQLETLHKEISLQARASAVEAGHVAAADKARDYRRRAADAKRNMDLAALAAEKKSDEAKLFDGLERGEILADGGGGGDRFEPIVDNPFMEIAQAPLSTFSIDVDTASYAKVRMYLKQHNMLPRPDAVRIEEMLNYFSYDYAPPQDEHPFAANVAVAQCPWNPQHRLARIAIKGKVIEEQRPASNLVFLLDVSGSMNRANKLPLVVSGMKMLTKQLGENDSVAIVVYAGAAGLVLDSTCGDDKSVIIDALDRLRAGGSTAGAQGIQLAYEVARDHFIVGGTNRVILCTDGDFNVGVTNTDQLVEIAEKNAKGDIFLSVLGFGTGNHNDAMMEKISNKGNGNYAFIDSEQEAHKVLVEQMGGTLVTIAKDVKIQVEFNPREVSSYRLIGYENRVLAAADFDDDTKDAGEIGAGHTVTALYELVPGDGSAELAQTETDDLRYQQNGKLTKRAKRGELLLLKLRYKQPTGTTSTLIEAPVKDAGQTFSQMDDDFKFAGTVAAFGMMLRGSPHKGNLTFAAVEEMAGDGIGQDKHGRRAEFIELVTRAKQLSGE